MTMTTDNVDKLDIDPTENIRKALAQYAQVGAMRYWRVRLRKSRTLPIEVALMEFGTESASRAKAKGISSMIGFDYTIADVNQIVEVAKGIIARVADYKQVIGDFIEEDAA